MANLIENENSIRPMNDNLFIRVREKIEEKLPSGLIIPQGVEHEKLLVGKIISIGRKVRDVLLEDAVVRGLDVLYFAGTTDLFETPDGQQYRLAKEHHVIAVKKPAEIFPLVCQDCGSLLDGGEVNENEFRCTCKHGYKMPWYPVGDRVFFTTEKIPEKVGSIHMPTGDFIGSSLKKMKDPQGVVIACGHGYWKNGVFTPTHIDVGAKVVFEPKIPESWFFEVDVNGKKERVRFCGSNDIYMTVD